MKKINLLILMAFCSSSILLAQSQPVFKFSLGPELGFAVGSFSNTHSIGIGATAQAEVSLQKHLYGTATFGIISYNGKSVAYTGTKTTSQIIIPLRIGAKYFLSGGVYGAAQIGVGFLNNFYSGTSFAYSSQVGYEFNTKSGKALDVTFKYDAYSKNGTIGAIGFRVAYIF